MYYKYIFLQLRILKNIFSLNYLTRKLYSFDEISSHLKLKLQKKNKYLRKSIVSLLLCISFIKYILIYYILINCIKIYFIHVSHRTYFIYLIHRINT